MQNVENIILNKNYTVKTGVPIENSYMLSRGEKEQEQILTSNQNPTLDFNDSGWSRFYRGLNREIIIKFDKTTAIAGFSITFLQDKESGIYSPREVSLSVSDNGIEYAAVFSQKTNVSPSDPERKLSVFEINGDKRFRADYVKLVFNIDVFAFACNFCVFGCEANDSEELLPCQQPVNYVNSYKYGDDGFNSAVIIYCGYWDKTMNYGEHYVNNSTEAFLPYAAYVDKNGKIKDTMFDSILFLALQSRNPSGGYSVFHTHCEVPFTIKEDFDYFIDNIFQDEFNMGALEKALDIVKEQLELADYKINVSIQIPFPYKTDALFGIINDREQYSRTIEERTEIAKYFIDTVTERFKEKEYKNITLSAFYQGCESVPFSHSDDEYELFKSINQTVHQAGYKATWIPLYLGSGFDCTQELGFDYAYMQPNYMFHNWGKGMLDEFAKTIYRYGLGSEIEINYSCVNPENENFKCDYEKYFDYLRSGSKNGYMFAANAYYQGAAPGYFYTAAYSENNEVRLVYDKTYEYIKKTLIPTPPVIKDESFYKNNRGQIIGKLSMKIPKDDIFKGESRFVIIKNPKQGLLHLKENGEYVYTPYYNFKNSDGFVIAVEREGLYSNEITVTIDMVDGEIKHKMNEQSENILRAKRLIRKAEAYKKVGVILAGAGLTAAYIAMKFLLKNRD